MDIIALANKIARKTNVVNLQNSASILKFKIEQTHRKLLSIFDEIRPGFATQQKITVMRAEFNIKKAEAIERCDLFIANLKMAYMEKEIKILQTLKNEADANTEGKS